MKSQKQSRTISKAPQLTGRQVRRAVEIQHKQTLSAQQAVRVEAYSSKMQQLHRAQNALEAQRKTPEY